MLSSKKLKVYPSLAVITITNGKSHYSYFEQGHEERMNEQNSEIVVLLFAYSDKEEIKKVKFYTVQKHSF